LGHDTNPDLGRETNMLDARRNGCLMNAAQTRTKSSDENAQARVLVGSRKLTRFSWHALPLTRLSQLEVVFNCF
jgi:hypothetical protein